jgi:hypothetical protein
MANFNVAKSAEIDRNLAKFLELLPEISREHPGKWALLKDASIIDFYDSAMDAQIAGNNRFDDQLFSIQPVTEEVEMLGYFSYAVDRGPA